MQSLVCLLSKKHLHLNLVQRYQIEVFLKAGMKQKKIGDQMMVAEVLKADYHFTSFHTSQDKGTVEKRI